MAGAYPRSRTHSLWLRLCAPELRREGGARSRERSCWCVEILGASEPALGAARLEQAAETKATVSVGEGPHDGPDARGAKYRAAARKAEGERGPGLSALRTWAADWGCGLRLRRLHFPVWARSSREDRRMVLFILREASFHCNLHLPDGGGATDPSPSQHPGQSGPARSGWAPGLPTPARPPRDPGIGSPATALQSLRRLLQVVAPGARSHGGEHY